MQNSVCPRLGIQPALASALQAWVHLQQYTAHGDLRMLAHAKAHLRKFAEASPARGTARPPAQQPAQPPLIDVESDSGSAGASARDAAAADAAATAATAEHGFQIREAIRGELLRKASDVFAECTPEQVPHVFDLVLFASDMAAEERRSQLHHMFVSSVDLEVDRCWESASRHAAEPAANGNSTSQRNGRTQGRADAASSMSLFLLTLQVR